MSDGLVAADVVTVEPIAQVTNRSELVYGKYCTFVLLHKRGELNCRSYTA